MGAHLDATVPRPHKRLIDNRDFDDPVSLERGID